MDDPVELERLRATFLATLKAGLLEVVRGMRETLASPPGSFLTAPGPDADAATRRTDATLAKRPPAWGAPAWGAELQVWLPEVRGLYPDAVEVTPALAIELAVRGDPPESFVWYAVRRGAQLYSPATRTFLLVRLGGAIALLNAESHDGGRERGDKDDPPVRIYWDGRPLVHLTGCGLT